MGNGTAPPRVLSNADYQLIKNGTLITSGTYAGCIRTGSRPNFVYYSVEPDGRDWGLATGLPGPNQCPITTSAWDRCKSGGFYDWNVDDELWENDDDDYRWGGNAGYDIQLVKL